MEDARCLNVNKIKIKITKNGAKKRDNNGKNLDKVGIMGDKRYIKKK